MAEGPSDQDDEATWPSLTCMESLGTAHRGQGSMPAGPRLCPPRSPATACGSAVRHQLRPNRPGPVPQERTTLGTHAPAVVAAHPQVGQDVLSTPPPAPVYQPRPRRQSRNQRCGRPASTAIAALGQVSAQTWAGLYQPTPTPRKKKWNGNIFF